MFKDLDTTPNPSAATARLPDERLRRKSNVALVSVLSNSALVAFKLAIGFLMGSVSILSEAIHSGIDLVASVITLASVRAAARPADSRHPFGHGKFENISGATEALLIFLAAGWIVREAVDKLRHPRELEFVGWGVGVMLLSAVVNWRVSGRLFRIAQEADSVALKADAWHLRTDVYTSVGVMTGLLVIGVVERWFPGFDIRWMDSLAALVVAVLILKTAWELTVESVRDLLDVRLPEGEEKLIREHIEKLYPQVCGFHDLRTRKGGATRFVQFHLKVAPSMSVQDSHRISHELTDTIQEHYPDAQVTIHVEPCRKDCLPPCVAGCLLPEAERGGKG